MRAILFATLICVATARATSPEQIAALFRPFIAEEIVLSPDGRRVAYTEHVGQELRIVIMKLEAPYAKVTLLADDDRELIFSQEKRRANLRFLRWATPNRLVFAPSEEVTPGPRSRILSPVLAVDADGKNPRTLLDGPDLVATVDDPRAGFRDVSRHSRIIGFAPGDRDHLLVQALGREMRLAPAPDAGAIGAAGSTLPPLTVAAIVPTTLFKVNVHTGKRTTVVEDFFNGQVAYDRAGRSRLSYATPTHSLERTFSLLGPRVPKFDAALLGPLAAEFRITPQNYFGAHAYPLGFDLDPDVLLIASNLGRDTFGVYALNLKTRQRTDLALEHPHVDLASLEPTYPSPLLVFDEARGHLVGVRNPGAPPVAVWRDPELAAAQNTLEQKFTGRTVALLGWSEARDVFLVRVTGGTEPGRTYTFQRKTNRLLEILRSAPWLRATDLGATEFFEFDTPQGVHLTGYVTQPRNLRRTPPPVLVCFASGFPGRPHAEFDREAQVLAAMGVVVLRLNHRGVGRFGLAHRDAILAGIDRAPVEDALAAVDWLARQRPIDRKRIATLGYDFGGYLAVRALQLHPDAFRAAIAFNALLDPSHSLTPAADFRSESNFYQEATRAFLQRGQTDLAPLSVLHRTETLTRPVFLVVNAARTDAVGIDNARLRDQLRGRDITADYIEVNADFTAGLPAARRVVYDRLEEFLNLNLYDFKVKIGESTEIK